LTTKSALANWLLIVSAIVRFPNLGLQLKESGAAAKFPVFLNPGLFSF
jgi:hypothetical protein